MRSFCLWISCLVFAASTAAADEPGDFTHYVMALSWNAAWCEAEGDARNADQCAARHDHGWLLHGLWPQQENGWPEYCLSTVRDPSRRMSATMEDIMGSGGLAWYQWKKHGRCTGLEAQDYFDLSRAAYESIKRPNILRRISQAMALPPKVIEDAFLEANPELKASQIAVKCRDGAIREVRICLTKGLVTRHCTPQVARECSASSVSFVPMR